MEITATSLGVVWSPHVSFLPRQNAFFLSPLSPGIVIIDQSRTLFSHLKTLSAFFSPGGWNIRIPKLFYCAPTPPPPPRFPPRLLLPPSTRSPAPPPHRTAPPPPTHTTPPLFPPPPPPPPPSPTVDTPTHSIFTPPPPPSLHPTFRPPFPELLHGLVSRGFPASRFLTVRYPARVFL